MKARSIIQGASFEPRQLKAIGKAFDDAWEQITPHVSDYPRAHDDARLKLAEVILILAHEGFFEPHALTQQAVIIMLADPNGL